MKHIKKITKEKTNNTNKEAIKDKNAEGKTIKLDSLEITEQSACRPETM